METNTIDWNYGPDTLYVATKSAANHLAEAVTIRIGTTSTQSQIVSIYTRFKRTVEKGPKKIALGKYS
jgi:hypothetical protein